MNDETGLYIAFADFPTLVFGWEWCKDERYFQVMLGIMCIGYQFRTEGRANENR